MNKKLLYYSDLCDLLGAERLEFINQSFIDGFLLSVQMVNYGLSIDQDVEYEMRTKADLAHDHIKAKLKRQFQNDDLVKVAKVGGIFALLISDLAFCRVKKFIKETAQVSVYQTKQQKDFNNQVPMDGVSETATYITLGYHHDDVWSKIRGVYASCYRGDTLLWFSKIGGEGFSQINMFEQPPTKPNDTNVFTKLPAEKTRTRSKKIDLPATGTDDSRNNQ